MGKVIHPVFGLPGGVSKGVAPEDRDAYLETAKKAVEFSKFALELFGDVVLKNEDYVNLVLNDAYAHQTYYMGLVDENNKVNFYDGDVRVVDPTGKEYAKFAPRDYTKHIAEHVEPWSLHHLPLPEECRLEGLRRRPRERRRPGGAAGTAERASDGMPTPLAQASHDAMYEVLGGKPAHNTLAFNWARLVEAQCAAELMVQLLEDPEITSDDLRNEPTETPDEGVGIVEAPRGTLIHHYWTDDKGVMTQCNLIVATNHNAAPIAMSVERAAKGMIKGGEVNDGLLNMVEMAFRAYDPCHACATHAIGTTPLVANIYDSKRRLIKTIKN